MQHITIRRHATTIFWAIVLSAGLAPLACSGGDGASGGGEAGSGQAGAAGANAGGAAGSGIAGAGGSAGANAGGAAGSGIAGQAGQGGGATGGAAGGSGTGGAAASFWTDTYNPQGLPSPADGNHNAGNNCLQCHKSGKSFKFAGTVYAKDGVSPAAHVQVGVRAGGKLYTAYSATNGNFFIWGANDLNWSNTEVRIRTESGEKKMSNPGGPACNSCHASGNRITVP